MTPFLIEKSKDLPLIDATDSAPKRNGLAPFTVGRYSFKMADQEDEFQQIHQLNCRTFVHEINQHPDPGSDGLVDQFHHKNIYFIGKRDTHVVGMLCLHGEPPYSVAEKLDDPAVLDDLEQPLLEARLLSVVPHERSRSVIGGLFWCLNQYARHHGFRQVVISGLTDRLSMYQHLGFHPLGPPVRRGQAEFIPMVLDLTDLPRRLLQSIEKFDQRRTERAAGPNGDRMILLQPGPVEIRPEVEQAFHAPSVSHRSSTFVQRYEGVRRDLANLTGAEETALLVGSSTVANDVVAATLKATPSLQRGLILVNGEFGRRLHGQAQRFELPFESMQWNWGQPWDHAAIAERLRQSPEIHWIWATHLETSTGMVNDVDRLRALADAYGVRVCLDCVSSLGAVPLNLGGTYLASGTSGKSLASYAGIAMVFASGEALRAAEGHDRLPEYLDLVEAVRTRGPRFTIASPLLDALEQSLVPYAQPEQRRHRYESMAAVGRFVRSNLRTLGADVLVDEHQAAPTVTTFFTPTGIAPETFCRFSSDAGYILGGLSGYLKARSWLQLATMGEVDCRTLEPLFESLHKRLKAHRLKKADRLRSGP